MPINTFNKSADYFLLHPENFLNLKKRIIKNFAVCTLFAVNLLFWNPAFANTLEYKVKAVLTFKIMSYVQLPSSAFNDDDGIFSIGVLGNDTVLTVFKSLEGKMVGNRTIAVRHATNLDNLTSFNSVFISQHSSLPWQEALDTLKGSSTLTLGEIENFAESGGMIGFYSVEDKIRFLINKEAAEKSGLKIKAQLFRVGKLVRN